MGKQAYELREQYRADYEETEGGPPHTPFAGGSRAWGPDGETIDFAELLEAGGGTIVTEEPAVQAYLDEAEPFRRTAVGAALEGGAAEVASPGPGEPPEAVEVVDPDEHSQKDLLAMAEAEGVDEYEGRPLGERTSKADIAAAINAARQGGDEGGN